jgi:hypothetical protein
MLVRREAVFALAGLFAVGGAGRAFASGPMPASERLNQAGSEAKLLAGRSGRWSVVETAWAAAGATPVTTSGLAARSMLGTLLQEIIQPPGNGRARDVRRTDLLSFNRLEGRWDYVSFDTRGPDGIMVAWSRDRGADGTIALDFAPFATPRPGTEAVGQLLRMDQVIRFIDEKHDVKEQFFMPADGSGARWLGHRYDYTRLADRS